MASWARFRADETTTEGATDLTTGVISSRSSESVSPATLIGLNSPLANWLLVPGFEPVTVIFADGEPWRSLCEELEWVES